MTQSIRTAGRILVLWTAILALALIWALPVSAHHKSDHAGGKGGSDTTSTEVTEDNDNDGQPNSFSGGASQHPSGKDRHIESGKSGNQGKSKSHPDDSKGPQRFEGDHGPDKPTSGTGSMGGGTNVYDQDGNNGCGNDQDFDDDNNGWCGRNPKKNKPVQVQELIPQDLKLETPVVVTQPVEPEVGGEVLVPGSTPEERVDNAVAENTVAGVQVRAAKRASVLGSVLPFTGSGLVPFLGAALSLMGAGTLLIGMRRR